MYNRVELIGRLTADPEFKSLENGFSVVNFSVATTTLTWKDKETGEKKEKTEFSNCVAYNKMAEVISKHFTKGKPIFIAGRLETRNWEDKDTGKKMYRTEVIATELRFLPDKSSGNGAVKSQTEQASTEPNTGDLDFFEE